MSCLGTAAAPYFTGNDVTFGMVHPLRSTIHSEILPPNGLILTPFGDNINQHCIVGEYSGSCSVPLM